MGMERRPPAIPKSSNPALEDELARFFKGKKQEESLGKRLARKGGNG